MDDQYERDKMHKTHKISPIILFLFITFFIIFIFSMLAPVLFPTNLAETHLENRLADPVFINSQSKHLFGTDSLGRDVAIRLIYATRMTLIISFVGMIIATLLGTIMGVLGGMYGGAVDLFVTFLIDVRLSIPITLIGIMCAVVFGANEKTVILIISLTGWSGFSRLIRGQVIQLKEASFIESSKALGASKVRILFEHIIGNIASPLIVQATLNLSSFILLESSLSFLGLGIQPPNTSLGIMVSIGRNFMLNKWWLAIIPSIVIVVIIMQISLIGDWLRDKLDPKLRNL